MAHGEPRTDRLFSVREVGGRGGRGRPGSHHISTVASVPSRVGCGSRSEAVERCVSSYCTCVRGHRSRSDPAKRSFNGRTRTYRRPLSTSHDLHRSDYWDQQPEHKVQAAHRHRGVRAAAARGHARGLLRTYTGRQGHRVGKGQPAILRLGQPASYRSGQQRTQELRTTQSCAMDPWSWCAVPDEVISPLWLAELCR